MEKQTAKNIEIDPHITDLDIQIVIKEIYQLPNLKET